MKWSDLPFWKSQRWADIQSYLALHPPYYPEKPDVFNALKFTPLDKVKVVILGQDPYSDNHANGLAFSCNKWTNQCPPSLKNILKEYSSDTKWPMPSNGNLVPWAREGVLMINSLWTVAPGKPMSHKDIGWHDLTTEIIQTVRTHQPKAVFVLWGKEAQSLAVPLIGGASRVCSPHPSPRSAERGFFGSRPFSQTNALLQANGVGPVNWFLRFHTERIGAGAGVPPRARVGETQPPVG